MYIKHIEGFHDIYMLLYFDDILVAYKDKKEIIEIKVVLAFELKMKDFGKAKKILGMNIRRDMRLEGPYSIQKDYLKKVLKKFNMYEAKQVEA